MAEIVYVVLLQKYQEENKIEALFSNEGLAQTHRAKLAVGFPKGKFVVEARELDTEVAVEPVYWAYTTILGSNIRNTNLNIRAQADGVHATLPGSSTQHDPADGSYGFSAYGWDEASAKAGVQLLVDAWYEGLDMRID